MNELNLLFFVCVSLFGLYFFCVFVFCLLRKNYLSVLPLLFTFLATYLSVTFYSYAKESFFNKSTDLVYIVILFSIIVAFLAIIYGFLMVNKNKNMLTPVTSQILVIAPALFWSLIWLLSLRKIGPIHFEFFGTQKVTNTNMQVSLLVCLALFISEYVGNIRHVEAKVAEVVTLFGKRSGQSLTEGFNLLPGILPLAIQVGIYSVFRFSIFWGSK